jgi:hypothetical protein
MTWLLNSKEVAQTIEHTAIFEGFVIERVAIFILFYLTRLNILLNRKSYRKVLYDVLNKNC